MLVSRVKSSVAATLPKPFADYLRRKIAVVRQNSRSPREVFSEIYRRNAGAGKPANSILDRNHPPIGSGPAWDGGHSGCFSNTSNEVARSQLGT